MVRFYVRKSTRGSWSEERMQQAINALGQGMPLKTCAAQFSVPRNTLRRHWLKKLKKHPGCTHLGRQSILGPSVEKDLVDYIMNLEDKGFGLTPTDVRELAFDYAERNNITHTFDKELKAAGLDWWSGFRLRHRSMLSIRKPEALSLARAAAMNRPAVTNYFKILEREMQRLGITDKPSCIYNCDESGLSLVPDTCKVVARKGKKNVYQVTSAERGVLTTVLPCYNAAGYYVPPMVIYKGKRATDGLRKNMPDRTLIAMSDTGYMNMELFQKWLEHFKKNLQEPNSPALLILDGHGAHVKAIDGLRYAERNQISIICLPPHTTHWTQPLDRCYFKPLKSNYAHECRKFMRDNPGSVITRYNFGKLFSAAYHKTSSMAIAIDSFHATGIYPVNKDIFPDNVFAPSQTTDRELPPSDGQIGSAGVVDGGQATVDGGLSTYHSSIKLNRFEMIKPLPKKVFDDNKRKRKSRSTTSRVLTSKQHITELEEELRLSAKKPKKLITQGTGKKFTEVKKKKKKATCRQDKPRGRRPSKATDAELQKKSKKKPVIPKSTQGGHKVGVASKTQTDVLCCAGCGEMEVDSVEEWIACTECQTWYELPCAGLLGKPKNIQDLFVCEECGL